MKKKKYRESKNALITELEKKLRDLHNQRLDEFGKDGRFEMMTSQTAEIIRLQQMEQRLCEELEFKDKEYADLTVEFLQNKTDTEDLINVFSQSQDAVVNESVDSSRSVLKNAIKSEFESNFACYICYEIPEDSYQALCCSKYMCVGCHNKNQRIRRNGSGTKSCAHCRAANYKFQRVSKLKNVLDDVRENLVRSLAEEFRIISKR